MRISGRVCVCLGVCVCVSVSIVDMIVAWKEAVDEKDEALKIFELV